jgi:hypothetical protein
MGWLLLRRWHHLPVLQRILVDVQAIPHSYAAPQPQAITLARSLRYGAPAAS